MIARSNALRIRFFGFCLLAVVVFPGVAYGAEGTESKVGKRVVLVPPPVEEELQAVPKNLSRWHMGATLSLSERGSAFTEINVENVENRPERPLLGDDETKLYSLDAGKHDFVVNLGTVGEINRFLIRSGSTGGTLALRSSMVQRSLRSGRWAAVGEPIEFKPGEEVQIDFAYRTSQFLHVSLDISKPGTIGSFNVFGTERISDVRLDRERVNQTAALASNAPMIDYDYASLYSGSAVTHISSGDLVSANEMIDDDIRTGYTFDEEAESLVVLDLEEETYYDEVTIVFDAGPGRMEIYNFSILPSALYETEAEEGVEIARADAVAEPRRPSSRMQRGGAPGGSGPTYLPIVRVPPEFWDEHRPDHVKTVENPEENIEVEMEVMFGRYVLFRWVPAEGGSLENSLRIYEISVLGEIPFTPEMLARARREVPQASSFGVDTGVTPSPIPTIPVVSP